MNSSSLVKAHYHSSGSASELHQQSDKWAIKRETSSERQAPKQGLPNQAGPNKA